MYGSPASLVNPQKIGPKVFHRSDPAYRWRLWVKVLSRENMLRYHFYWRRIGIVLAALLLVAWLSGTAAFWANVRRGGIPEVRYVDLVLPFRWGHYRATVGAHILEQGRRELQNGNPNLALNYFNSLLTFEPGNLENRRLAAQAESDLGFESVALDVLRPGVAQAIKTDDEAFFRAYFPAAFDEQADDEAFEVARRILPAGPDSSAFHRYVALQAATARYNRRHDIEAEQILDAWKLRDTPEGEVLYAYCDAERGQGLSARVRLERDLDRFPQKDLIYLAIERLAREQGVPQATRLYALYRVIAEPKNPQTRIDLITADQMVGRTLELQKEIGAYGDDFKSDVAALTLLAQFAADTGDLDTAERARDLAKAADGTVVEFDLDVAEAALVAQDFRQALRTVVRAQADSGSEAAAYEATFNGFNAVAQFGAGDTSAELAFSDFLPRAGELRPAIGLFLVRELRRDGFALQSRQLLERVCTAHPDDQPALLELVRSEASAHDRDGLVANLPRLLEMRKPPVDALVASLACLDPKSDAPLRARVTAALGDSGPLETR